MSDIVEPFAEVAVMCQSETMTKIRVVVALIVHIIDHLKQMSTTVTCLRKLINQLVQSVCTRFTARIKYLLMKPLAQDDPFHNSVYFVTTFLDPKFRFYWISLMNYNESIASNLRHLMIHIVLRKCERSKKGHNNQSSLHHSQGALHAFQNGNSIIIKMLLIHHYYSTFS
jgi:hypothetical protein